MKGERMERPQLMTLEQVCEAYPIKLRTLRYWIQHASPQVRSRGGAKYEVPGNGLGPAIIKVDRIILIDETKFVEWLNSRRMAA